MIDRARTGCLQNDVRTWTWNDRVLRGLNLMPPKFPKSSKIALKNPPLELVVCQLRFPLLINLNVHNPPTTFQKELKKTYPIAGSGETTTLQLTASVGAPIGRSQAPFWFFEDRNSEWHVSIAPNFLSLEAKKYKDFAEFLKRFQEVLAIAIKCYDIEVRERLGLRYLNRISETKESKLPSGWCEKLQSEILPLRDLRNAGEPQLTKLESRFMFGENILAVKSQFADSTFPGIDVDELLLDFDCYDPERRDLANIADRLNEFKGICYDAFRWAMNDVITYFDRAET